MKNSNDTIGNQTRILLAHNGMPQPIKPPCAPPQYSATVIDNFWWHIKEITVPKNLCQCGTG
jgi:hypothetical protein